MLIDHTMRGGEDFCPHLSAMGALLARDFLLAKIVFHDPGVLAIPAVDEMLVGQGRQRLTALVADFVRIALGGQQRAQAFTVPVAVAVGKDFGVAFVGADHTQAAGPRDARLCFRYA
jgi:hypothetical protein